MQVSRRLCVPIIYLHFQILRWPTNDQQDAHDFLLWLRQKLHAEHVLHSLSDVSAEAIDQTTSTTQVDEGHSPVTDLINVQFTITYQCVCSAAMNQ